MATPQRAPVDLDPELHRALRDKAAHTERLVADLLDEAVRLSLHEDREDEAAFAARENEPGVPFEDVLDDFRRRGLL